MKTLFICVALVGCGTVKGDPVEPDAAVPDDMATELPDTEPAPVRCSHTAPATVSIVDHINSPSREERATLTTDELELYVTRANPTPGGFDIFRSTRSTTTSDWSTAQRIDVVNPGDVQQVGAVANEGRSLYTEVVDVSIQIEFTSRASTSVEFGALAPLASINTAKDERWPSVDPDELGIYFWSDREVAGGKLYRATRTTKAQAFGAPVEVVLPAASIYSPVVTADGLAVYHYSLIDGKTRLSTRASLADPFDAGTVLADIPGWVTWISPDNCRLYVSAQLAGGVGDLDMQLATRQPD